MHETRPLRRPLTQPWYGRTHQQLLVQHVLRSGEQRLQEHRLIDRQALDIEVELARDEALVVQGRFLLLRRQSTLDHVFNDAAQVLDGERSALAEQSGSQKLKEVVVVAKLRNGLDFCDNRVLLRNRECADAGEITCVVPFVVCRDRVQVNMHSDLFWRFLFVRAGVLLHDFLELIFLALRDSPSVCDLIELQTLIKTRQI